MILQRCRLRAGGSSENQCSWGAVECESQPATYRARQQDVQRVQVSVQQLGWKLVHDLHGGKWWTAGEAALSRGLKQKRKPQAKGTMAGTPGNGAAWRCSVACTPVGWVGSGCDTCPPAHLQLHVGGCGCSGDQGACAAHRLADGCCSSGHRARRQVPAGPRPCRADAQRVKPPGQCGQGVPPVLAHQLHEISGSSATSVGGAQEQPTG